MKNNTSLPGGTGLRSTGRILLLSLCWWIHTVGPTDVLAAVGAEKETIYTEALAAFHSKKYDETLKILGPWTSSNQPPVTFLELRGLALKEKGDLPNAYETYRKLFEIASPSGLITKEAAPYAFEMGVVKYHQKDFTAARRHLLAIKDTDFNSDATHFLLGAMDFSDKRYGPAEENLQQVVSEEESSLRSAAHLYLGNIYAQSGHTRAAIRNFRNARRIASKNVEQGNADPLTAQVSSASAKALLGTARARTTASIALLGAYDSNVFLIPTTLVASTGTGESTVKGIFLGNVGYESSLLRRWQFTADYRTSFNYNVNTTTQIGQYFANDLALQVNRDPLETTSWGLKLETIGVVRASSASFSLYNLSPFFGPVLTHEFSPSLVGKVELLGYYQSYNEDVGTTDQYFKTGFGGRAKFALQRQVLSSNWNPSVSLTLDMASTQGTEFRSKSGTIDFNNTLEVGKKSRLIPSVSVGYVTYSDRPDGARTDIPFTVGTTFLYELKAKWAMLANASYTFNQSNITELYRYSRIQSSLGVSHNF